MTWFDSTVPYQTTSTSAADCLPYKEEVGGSSPSSSTVAEVEVVDTPGCDPGGSRFESGRSPHLAGDLEISGGSYSLPGGFDSRPRHHWAGSAKEAQLPCKETAAGSTPARSTRLT